MFYETEINGIRVGARFSDEDISGLFLPLLGQLARLRERKGRRVLIFLAAPPGAGKTTLADFLKSLSERGGDCQPVTVAGMDGFHRYQEYLLTHTVLRGGTEIPMVKVKGAPETFDLARLRERVARVAAGEVCGWPEYDRLAHNPREDAVEIDGDIVLLEGNYLLLNRPGWRELRDYADYTVRLDADEDFLRKRLIERRIKTGVSREEAVRFVDFSDMENVRTCLAESADADLTWRVDARGFSLAERGRSGEAKKNRVKRESKETKKEIE